MALDNNKKNLLNSALVGGCYLQHSSPLSKIPEMILSLIQ